MSHGLTTCELWESKGFQEGYLVWDADAYELVDIDSVGDSVLQQIVAEWEDSLNDEEVAKMATKTGKAPKELSSSAPSLKCYCTPPHEYACSVCKVERNNPKEPWRRMKDKGITTSSVKSTGYATTWGKCRHYFEPVKFPNGITLYASSLLSPKERQENERPDFGMYFATSWKPITLAYMFDWPDFGVPNIGMEVVLEAVDEAISRAKKGQKVEVGCIGGHGRTGTFLALVALRSGVSAKKAKRWVNKHYCHEAVEGQDQEWYIRAMDAFIHGKPLPKKPPKPVYTYSGGNWKKTFNVTDPARPGVTIVHWWEGEWSKDKRYTSRDVVRRHDFFYKCIKMTTGDDPANIKTRDVWEPVADDLVPAAQVKEHDDYIAKKEKEAKGGKDSGKTKTSSPSVSASVSSDYESPLSGDEFFDAAERKMYWRGRWRYGRQYLVRDVVMYLQAYYECIDSHYSKNAPTFDTRTWKSYPASAFVGTSMASQVLGVAPEKAETGNEYVVSVDGEIIPLDLEGVDSLDAVEIAEVLDSIEAGKAGKNVREGIDNDFQKRYDALVEKLKRRNRRAP